jgi:pimeloyl-ACP methyl ester carboxylesterase
MENGQTIVYQRCGQGAALVLVHGFPLDGAMWQPLADLLAGHFELIIPDLPGFGASPTLPDGASMDALASSLVGLLDVLGIPQAYLAGHSMGGYVVLALAQAHPGRVLGLALLGSQAMADSPERQAARFVTAEQITQAGVSAVLGMAEKLSATPALVPVLREIILRQNAAGLAAAQIGMAGRADLTPWLAGYQLPLVLVHGSADELISPERARELAQMVAHAAFFELPGVGHTPMLEDPDSTARALLGLLD